MTKRGWQKRRENERPIRKREEKTVSNKTKQTVSTESVINHLKAFVEREKLQGGSKIARDQVKIELQNHVVDSLVLPDEKKRELKTLLAKRMRIQDNLILAKNVGRTNVEETLAIFHDFQDQINAHKKGFLNQVDWSPVLRMLGGEISDLEKASQVKKELGFNIVIKTPQARGRVVLLDFANRINGELLKHHLSSHFDAFNLLVTHATNNYLNPHFPISHDDLTKQFFERTGPKKQ